jgi:regulatory protein
LRQQRSYRTPKTTTVGAFDAGLNLLVFRAHSRSEIRRKLGRKGYGEEEVESAVARLIELGYLDDRSFAEAHVRRRSSALGPRALSAELAARGIDRAIADAVLGGFDEDRQLGTATHLAERLRGRKAFPGYREMLDSVGPKLLRRGFSAGIVRTACRQVWNGTSTAD